MTAAVRLAYRGTVSRNTHAFMEWRLRLPMTRCGVARAMLACLDEDLRRAPPGEVISWLAACGFTNKEIEIATPLLARLLARHKPT